MQVELVGDRRLVGALRAPVDAAATLGVPVGVHEVRVGLSHLQVGLIAGDVVGLDPDHRPPADVVEVLVDEVPRAVPVERLRDRIVVGGVAGRLAVRHERGQGDRAGPPAVADTSRVRVVGLHECRDARRRRGGRGDGPVGRHQPDQQDHGRHRDQAVIESLTHVGTSIHMGRVAEVRWADAAANLRRRTDTPMRCRRGRVRLGRRRIAPGHPASARSPDARDRGRRPRDRMRGGPGRSG